MNKPKFFIGQQVVAVSDNTSSIGIIASGDVLNDMWRYGVKFDVDSSSVTFVIEHEVTHALVDNKWVPNTDKRIGY